MTADDIMDATAKTESGNSYSAFNPNDNGHGISFGFIQFNQKVGSLPTLLLLMHQENPDLFTGIFGDISDRLLTMDWVKKANLAKPDYRARFIEAGKQPEFQQVQRNLARKEYFNGALKLARRFGIGTERGVAMVFDLCVQRGVKGTENILKECNLIFWKNHPGDEVDARTMTSRYLGHLADLGDAGAHGGKRREKILRSQSFTDNVFVE